MKKVSSLREEIEEFKRVEKKLEEIIELREAVGDDPKYEKDIEKEIIRIEEEIQELELKALMREPDDRRNAILTIHPGAGGTESQDWAEMLLRMYIKWIEKKKFKYNFLNLQYGEEAGIKDATLLVEGAYAYGLLKAERGIHRLVRISPFDATRRRHTSFASVFVYPEIEEIEVKIKDEELKLETFRSSGPGGQHMQKNETAVRITHIPTGIVVTCQSERSQYQNKMIAMRILRARVYQFLKEKEMEKLQKIEKDEIGWGHQIRSYILHPYKLVKDHRTDYEISNVERVLDGEIDEFIRQYLLSKKR